MLDFNSRYFKSFQNIQLQINSILIFRMSKRRPIKDIVNSMQNDLENLMQNMVRTNLAGKLINITVIL